MWDSDPIGWCSYMKRKGHQRKDYARTQKGDTAATYKPGREVSPETNSDGNLIGGF